MRSRAGWPAGLAERLLSDFAGKCQEEIGASGPRSGLTWSAPMP